MTVFTKNGTSFGVDIINNYPFRFSCYLSPLLATNQLLHFRLRAEV
jgi:hypothetical protein